jgi:hypothetical protein
MAPAPKKKVEPMRERTPRGLARVEVRMVGRPAVKLMVILRRREEEVETRNRPR